jgi:RNA polymerase-binding transcription factor DksA
MGRSLFGKEFLPTILAIPIPIPIPIDKILIQVRLGLLEVCILAPEYSVIRESNMSTKHANSQNKPPFVGGQIYEFAPAGYCADSIDLHFFGAKLNQKCIRLENRLLMIKIDMTKSLSADSEHGQEWEKDQVLDELKAETEAALEDVRFALARIRQGAYGDCIIWDEKIDFKRLWVAPESLHCVSCFENLT